jgi:transcriptional regulator with XRE-family HTH domain
VSKVFAKNLREYRKRLGMTQAELADAIGMTRSAVNNYEAAKSEPAFETFVKIFRVLGLDPYDLMVEHESYPDYYRMMQVTEDEEFLLELYRHANPVYQQVAEDVLKQHQISGRFVK